MNLMKKIKNMLEMKKAQLGIKEIIYFVIGLLVLLLGYIIFSYSHDSIGIIGGSAEDPDIPGVSIYWEYLTLRWN